MTASHRFPRSLAVACILAAIPAAAIQTSPRGAPPAGLECLKRKGQNWQEVAQLKASPDAKEIGLDRPISAIRIVCVEAPVIINTVVVRRGSERESIRVGLRMEANQEHEIELGEARHCSGLRISDDNRGRYIVYVR